MAKAMQISTKRVAISKANAQIVAIVGGAAFLTVFCLFAAKASWSTNRYQAKVTKGKETAKTQLVANISAYNSLKSAYKTFDAADPNAIGGSKTGASDRDGTNSQLILDALPSSYDFPALASSLEKLLTDRGFQVESIQGSDDQLNQQTNISSPTPEAVPMPFSFGVKNASYQSITELVDAMNKSIRPIAVDSISMTGSSGNLSLNVNAHTYYQPAKNLDIKKQVVK